MKALHLATLTAALALCVVCVPEAEPYCISDAREFGYGLECRDLSRVELASKSVAADLSLSLNPAGWTVRYGPTSIADGEWDAGYRIVSARTDFPSKTIETSDPDLRHHLCHELVHVARGPHSNAEEHVITKDGCVSGWFCEHNVDGRCTEAMRGVLPSGASGE